ncbi:MAG: metallophosphoesterase family protein [Candidatus Eremiobacterota bacterium]
MKTGIISDSHGNYENLKKTGKNMVEKHKVELIIHMGDDSCEADILYDLNVKIITVPGVYEEAYKKDDIKNRLIEEINGWKCLISHTMKSHENDLSYDIKPEEVIEKKLAHVILYGHSHIPSLYKEHGIVFINPGHLKDEDKKGYGPSYAIADFTEDMVSVEIIDLKDGHILNEMTEEKIK